jgi:hypothetical protein
MAPWVKRWMNTADRMPWPSPIPEGDPTFIPLMTAQALVDGGEQYKNCLATKVPEVVLGRFLYLGHRGADRGPGAIVELRLTSFGWVFEGCYSADNKTVNAELADMIKRKLASCGVGFYGRAPGDARVLADTAKLLGIWPLQDNGCEDRGPSLEP